MGFKKVSELAKLSELTKNNETFLVFYFFTNTLQINVHLRQIYPFATIFSFQLSTQYLNPSYTLYNNFFIISENNNNMVLKSLE